MFWQDPAGDSIDSEGPTKCLFTDKIPRNTEQGSKREFLDLAFRILLRGCRDTNNRRGRVRHRWAIHVKVRTTCFSCELGSPHVGESLPVGDTFYSGPSRHIPFPTIFHRVNDTFFLRDDEFVSQDLPQC